MHRGVFWYLFRVNQHELDSASAMAILRVIPYSVTVWTKKYLKYKATCILLKNNAPVFSVVCIYIIHLYKSIGGKKLETILMNRKSEA